MRASSAYRRELLAALPLRLWRESRQGTPQALTLHELSPLTLSEEALP